MIQPPHPVRPAAQGACLASWQHALWLITYGLLACLLGAAAHAQSAATPSLTGQAVLLEVSGAIGPATTEYLERSMTRAVDGGATLIIIRLDTPGGLVSSMRDINRAILASPIPVITYVAPSGAQAASAGTYLVYASHLAAMAPGTNLGAATPVQMGGAPPAKPEDTEEGKPPQPDPHSAKAENDAVAYIRSLAALQGRNADWAESAVRQAASLPAQQALEQGVVEIIALDLDDLLAKMDGRSVQLHGKAVTLSTQGLTVTAIEPNWRARLLAAITNPNLAYILLLLGIYGIVFELMTPGAIFPGTLGAIALITALLAFNMLPINFAGIGLLLLGIALMVAEAFVSSFGLLGIGGLLTFAIGSFFLFDGSTPGFSLSPLVIVVAALASLVLLALMMTSVLRAHRRKVVSGDEALVGSIGQVLRWSGTQGLVLAHGETWQARCSQALQPGATVRITQREGLVISVVPHADNATQGG